MLSTKLANLSAATGDNGFVEYGYAQVEPNHLSAQRTGQIYAQLPAAAAINKLENGQFVKYDYVNNVVNFTTGAGEWMLVYNEIKLYREGQADCEFAMLKGNYGARIYSPLDPDTSNTDAIARHYGVNSAFAGKEDYQWYDYDGGMIGYGFKNFTYNVSGNTITNYTAATIADDGVDTTTTSGKTTITFTNGYKITFTTPTGDATTATLSLPTGFMLNVPNDTIIAPEDVREWDYTTDPFHIQSVTKAKKMPDGTTMVPRVFKTNVGDIFTTNAVTFKSATPAVGGYLYVAGTTDATTNKTVAGFLHYDSTAQDLGDGNLTGMAWQIVKVYTMPDGQKGVKVMRVQ